ncbi:CHAT domain-containing protein [Actinoplanes sp. NPDC051851]|uniref:CHAT domain-containing tetratricopeptide repeat protein n=1 Tax=Actinoplanes sp. NPDC051851 TaxID=3154753 RepID=UPI0034256A39
MPKSGPAIAEEDPEAWDQQATTMLERFLGSGDADALDRAIDLLRRAVSALPADRARPAGLGAVVRSRFGRGVRTNSRDRARLLSNLAGALAERFESCRDPDDLDEAIEAGRAAVLATPPGHQLRAGFLNNLGHALRIRFWGGRDLGDLSESIAAYRGAVRSVPPGDPDEVRFLATLGNVLLQRFQEIGEPSDLDEAVEAGRDARQIAGTEHPDRVMALFHLSETLQARFERFKEPPDLDEAIELGRSVLRAMPLRDPDRAGALSTLGAALRTRIEWSGEPADLDEAVEIARAAERVAPGWHPKRAEILFEVGEALHARFERARQHADLDEAIDVGRAAVRAATGNANRAAMATNLGVYLKNRFERSRDASDLEESLGLWREAVTETTAPASARMFAARNWGALAAQQRRWPDAADGYAAAVTLPPLLVWRGVSRAGRERLLADWGGLAVDAAACAIAAGQPDRAVELLEQGRGVLWSQLLEDRTELDMLRGADPRLAARLDAVRDDLDVIGAAALRPSGGDYVVDAGVRMDLARQWESLVDEARTLPGFADFARPPQAARLRHGAAGGTVVMVNVSPWRCDALLVTETGVEVVELPDLTHDVAVDRAATHLRALRTEAARIGLEQTVTTTLEWLWDVVAEPVLTALDHRHTPAAGQPWPRVWWCPTGALTVLPLHAAGRHDGSDGRSVLDRVVSSYTPTLRALASAKARPRLDQQARLLLVAVPHTPGRSALPAVAAEQALLTALFPAERRTLLVDGAATRAAILGHLPAHAWVHASCHGDQVLTDPGRGGLLPYDWSTAGLVGIPDTTTGDHRGGDFVFLAACKTATGGTTNADEVISLAAALHHTGWRHVIGTLWSVWDAGAADITGGVYQRLVRHGHLDSTHCAEALHHAVRAYRDQDDHRYQPSRWAPFLHIGP